MDEGEVRMLASVYEMVAQMSAFNARIEGMKAANAFRAMLDESPAYSEGAFNHIEIELENLSTRFKEEI